MTLLKYKEYIGSVEYEDGKLIIQLLHIDDFVSTECSQARDVQPAFEQLVEEYLVTCKEIGKEPNKPFKGSFNVRMPPELHKRCAVAASAENLSLNAWIVCAIEDFLAENDDAQLIEISAHSLKPKDTHHTLYEFHREEAANLDIPVEKVSNLTELARETSDDLPSSKRWKGH